MSIFLFLTNPVQSWTELNFGWFLCSSFVCLLHKYRLSVCEFSQVGMRVSCLQVSFLWRGMIVIFMLTAHTRTYSTTTISRIKTTTNLLSAALITQGSHVAWKTWNSWGMREKVKHMCPGQLFQLQITVYGQMYCQYPTWKANICVIGVQAAMLHITQMGKGIQVMN